MNKTTTTTLSNFGKSIILLGFGFFGIVATLSNLKFDGITLLCFILASGFIIPGIKNLLKINTTILFNKNTYKNKNFSKVPHDIWIAFGICLVSFLSFFSFTFITNSPLIKSGTVSLTYLSFIILMANIILILNFATHPNKPSYSY